MRVCSCQPLTIVVLAALVAAGCGGGGEGTAPGPFATQPVFVAQPVATVAGTTIAAVRVEARTGAGAVVTTFTGTITVALSGGPAGAALLGSSSAAAVAGVATFADLRIERSGAGYTLVAGSANLPVATSTAFDVAAGTATQLALTTGPADASGGRPINPAVVVAVRDAFGNLVPTGTPTVRMAIAANPGTATLSGVTSVSAVSGIATFGNLRLDRPGSGYTLQATSDGVAAVTSAPFAVRIVFASVSTAGPFGGGLTCGLTTGGAAYCWGRGNYGQLGTGTLADRTTPSLVAGELTFISVSAGSDHACGVTVGGAAYCWGNNALGQLGDGTNSNRSTPVPVLGGLTFSVVSAGDYHNCGLTAGGALHCWGFNEAGALGDGTTTLKRAPVAVVGGLSVTRVSAGTGHTCALTATGSAHCWGANPHSQLGDGSTADRTAPVAGAGGLNFAAVRAGFRYTCGATTAGVGYCWGLNSSSQGGDGTMEETRPTPFPISGGLSFTAVQAGAGQFTCGLTTSGAAYCWGSNFVGELGNGASGSRVATPTAVAGGLTFASLTSGGGGACGVTAAGVAYCWGFNKFGEIGDGSTTTRLVPTRVSH